MEAIRSSEMSVDFQRTTRRYIPEDRTLYRCCENFKSYTFLVYLATLSVAEALSSNDRISNYYLIGQDLKGSGFGLFWAAVSEFDLKNRETPLKASSKAAVL
jgi:hypothetical protein